MKQRFVVGNSPKLKDIRGMSQYINGIDLIINKSILVISDVSYFITNESEIKKWCDQSLTTWAQKGMILGFVNDEERNLFLLKWS
jgi:hypothetical protein